MPGGFKLCAVKGCGNQLRKGSEQKFHTVPMVNLQAKNQGHKFRKQLARRMAWLKVLNIPLETAKRDVRVCSDHFHSGSPSHLYHEDSVDWVPSLKMEGLKTCQVTKEMDHDVSHQQMLNDTDDQPLSEKIPNNGREQERPVFGIFPDQPCLYLERHSVQVDRGTLPQTGDRLPLQDFLERLSWKAKETVRPSSPHDSSI